MSTTANNEDKVNEPWMNPKDETVNSSMSYSDHPGRDPIQTPNHMNHMQPEETYEPIRRPVFYTRGQVFDQLNRKVCNVPGFDKRPDFQELGAEIVSIINQAKTEPVVSQDQEESKRSMEQNDNIQKIIFMTQSVAPEYLHESIKQSFTITRKPID